MKKIVMQPYEKIFLSEKKIFTLKEGKIILKSIAPNGKIINNNMCLKKGEILFNWFNFFEDKEKLEVEIEVEALEKTELEEMVILNEIKENIYQSMLFQLMKKSILELQYQLYNTKGYILVTLKIYACERGKLNKKSINPEYFNVGKTQFYKVYKEIKVEEFVVEERGIVNLNIPKIDEYLFELTME